MQPNPFGLAYSLSPVDLPEPIPASPRALGWTNGVIAVAALMLLALNAHAIRAWAWQLPAGPVSAKVIVVAESWYDAVDKVGLNRPVAALRSGWQSVKHLQF